MLILILGLTILVLLVGYFKWNPFISFLIVAFFIGVGSGMDVVSASKSIQKGLGGTLGFIVIILGLGAMIGKLVADSGAAQSITKTLSDVFGRKHIAWALVLTGFVVGIPMFYSVGFVILVPLVFAISQNYKLPLIYVAIPLLSALSVTHGYLPPHPAPSALVDSFGADMGMTLIYGIIVAIPAIILAGPLYGSTLKDIDAKPLKAFVSEPIAEDKLPSFGVSIMTALMPVFLLTFSTLAKNFVSPDATVLLNIFSALSDPIVALLLTLLLAIYTLGIARGFSFTEVMDKLVESVKSVAMIMLIIGGAGALKEIFQASGISAELGDMMQGLDISPLILAWLVAAFIRVCLGSATVAGLTAAGIVAPLLLQSDVSPELMVLAIGAGSLMFSHVNDSGFWMFKEYFNLTIKQTIRSWSIMETIVSVVGLIGVLILSNFI